MSEQREMFVRAQGADFRQHLSKLFMNCGPDLGLRLTERLVWEAADFAGEVCGAEPVVEMLYRAADHVVLDVVPLLDEGSNEEPDPLVLALEGMVTIQEQTRKDVSTMAGALAAVLPVVIELNDGLKQPTTWAGVVWRILGRLQWWPLAFIAGALTAVAFG